MMPLAPWKMWGQEVIIDGGAAGAIIESPQLARISYKRPETWGFLFYAEIVAGTLGVGEFVAIEFDIIVGVGLTRATLPTFVRFGFAGPTLPNAKIWTFSTRSPILDASVVPPDASRVHIDHITAEEIQVSARGTIPPSRVFRLATFWAPLSHVRPDWFMQEGTDKTRFRGGETGGT